jgi:hypothetical protein
VVYLETPVLSQCVGEEYEMDWTSTIDGIGAAVTVVSICVNVIQYLRKRDDRKSLRSHMQAEYNLHYTTARAATRVRDILANSSLPCEDTLNAVSNEVSVIRGVTDAARSSIIAYSREHLKYTPFYEHPAFPEAEVPDEVRLGEAPDAGTMQASDDTTSKDNEGPEH